MTEAAAARTKAEVPHMRMAGAAGAAAAGAAGGATSKSGADDIESMDVDVDGGGASAMSASMSLPLMVSICPRCEMLVNCNSKCWLIIELPLSRWGAQRGSAMRLCRCWRSRRERWGC